MPSRLSGAVEVVGCLALTLLAAWLAIVGILPLKGCIWFAASILITLLLLSWYRFDGGRHPCFLFMGTLLLFQGGRLIAYLTGAMQDPMQIDVGTPVPIHVPSGYAELTLLLIVLSAILVYAPCRLDYRRALYAGGDEIRWLPALYALVFVTFPFALYKNVEYLAYIRAHGGYLAVYTDNAAVLASAGPVARVLSLVNATAMLVTYVFERRPRRLRFILLLYFTISIFNLLIGFRGEFFSQALGIWFLYKLKTGRRFNIIPLLATGSSVAIISILAGAFREERSAATINPMIFVAVQGVSLNVTEAAVMYSKIFSRYGANYVWWGYLYNIVRAPDQPHLLWTADLSVFLNPVHAEMGFGTATSYLAELYLLGGVAAVVIGSLMIGYSFAYLHRVSSQYRGALAMAFLLPAMIYLPRVELLYPFAIATKALLSLIPIALFVLAYRSLMPPIRAALTRQNLSGRSAVDRVGRGEADGAGAKLL